MNPPFLDTRAAILGSYRAELKRPKGSPTRITFRKAFHRWQDGLWTVSPAITINLGAQWRFKTGYTFASVAVVIYLEDDRITTTMIYGGEQAAEPLILADLNDDDCFKKIAAVLSRFGIQHQPEQ